MYVQKSELPSRLFSADMTSQGALLLYTGLTTAIGGLAAVLFPVQREAEMKEQV